MGKKTAAAPAKKPKASGKARTYGDVAEHFGVHRDTVRREWKIRGMPSLPCDYETLQRWRETLRNGRIDDETLIAARREKILAEAEQKKAAAAITRYQATLLDTSVCTLEQIDQFVSQWFGELRIMLTRLPEEFAAAYPPDTRRQLEDDLRARVELILRAMHGHAAQLATIRD